MELYPRAIDLGLERIERLLVEMDSPHKKLPPVVHVAGTNGKGSLVAYLRAMAEAAGYRAHVYTSPHLVRFNERIRAAGAIPPTSSTPRSARSRRSATTTPVSWATSSKASRARRPAS